MFFSLDFYARIWYNDFTKPNPAMREKGKIKDMFCQKCGKLIEDGQSFCPECGTPVGNAPTNNGAPTKNKNGGKKNGKKIAIISVCAAVLVIAGILCAVFALGKKKGPDRKNMTPEEYFSDVEMTEVKASAKSLASVLDETGTSVSDFESGKVTVSLGDTILDMLGATADGAIDFGFLKDIGVDYSSSVTADGAAASAAVTLNGVHITDVNVYTDNVAGKVYINIPSVTDAYLAFDISDIEDNISADVTLPAEAADVSALIPSGEKLEEAIIKYAGIIIESITKVEKTEETITIGEKSADVTVLRATLDSEVTSKIAAGLAEALKDDEEVKEYLRSLYDAFGDEYTSFDDAYADFISTLESRASGDSDGDDENALVYTVMTDKNGEICGRSLMPADGEREGFEYKVIADKDSFVFEAWLGSDYNSDGLVTLSGSGKTSAKKLSADFTLSIGSEKAVSVTLADLDTSDGVSGKVDITLGSALEGELSSLIPSGTKISLDLGIGKKKAKIAADMNVLGASLAGITFESGGVAKDIPLFDTARAETASGADDILSWLSSGDYEGLLTNLSTAGVPDEIISGVRVLLSFSALY